MAKEKTETKCPNCLGPAVMEGSEITCETCDAVFTIKKTGGARVKTLGQIAELGDRVTRLEGLVPAGYDEAQPQEQQPQEPQETEESDNDLLPAR